MSGDELKRMRLQQRWSQQQLADALGVHVRTVSDWERGANGISTVTETAIRATFTAQDTPEPVGSAKS